MGDRVRDRRTGQEGRVIDLRLLADGLVLVTVALVVGGVVTQKKEFKAAQGRVGAPFEVTTPIQGIADRPTAETRDPRKGPVSAKAKHEAQQAAKADGRIHRQTPLTAREREVERSKSQATRWDQVRRREGPEPLDPHRPELRNPEPPAWVRGPERTAHWRAGRPAGATAPDPETWLDQIFDRKRYLRARSEYYQDELLREARAVDYVTGRTKARNATEGDLLHDFFMAPTRDHLPARVQEKVDAAQALLGGVIRPESDLGRRLGLTAPRSAFQILEDTHARMRHMRAGEGRAAWYRQAHLLTQEVRDRGRRHRQAQGEVLADDLRELAQWEREIAMSPEGAQALGKYFSSEMQEGGFTPYQAGELYNRLEGAEPVGIDMAALRSDTAIQAEREMHLAAGLPFTPAGIASRDAARTLDPLAFFERARRGQGVILDNVLHTVGDVSPTGPAILHPFAGGQSIFTPNPLRGVATLVEQTLPVAPVPPGEPLAGPALTHLNLRGGLAGGILDGSVQNEAVAVPVDLVKEFMFGGIEGGETSLDRLHEIFAGSPQEAGKQAAQAAHRTALVEEHLQRQGFRGVRDFQLQSQAYAQQFDKYLRARMRPQESLLLKARLSYDDVLLDARQLVMERLHAMGGTYSMGELEAELGQFTHRHILRSLKEQAEGGFGAVLNETKIETGKDGPRVRNLIGEGGWRYAMPGTIRDVEDQFLTDGEIRFRAGLFHGRTAWMRAEAREDPFETFFGKGHGIRRETVDYVARRARRLPKGERNTLLYDLLGELGEEFENYSPSDLLNRLQLYRDRQARNQRYRREIGQTYRELFPEAQAWAKIPEPSDEAFDPRAVARDLGVEYLEETEELRHLRHGLQKAERTFAAGGDAADLAEAEAAYRTAKRQLAAGIQLAGTDVPLTRADFHEITLGQQAQYAAKLNPLLERGDPEVLARLGFQTVRGANGQLGVKFSSTADLAHADLHYFPAVVDGQVAPDSGRLVRPGQTVGVAFGNVGSTQVGKQQVAELAARRRFVPGQDRAVQMAAREQALTSAVAPNQRLLPVFRSADGTLLGYSATGPIRDTQVLKNTARLLEGNDPFISLDVETSMETGQLLNVAATQYQTDGRMLKQVGRKVDLARPEFWATEDLLHVPEESVGAVKAGRVARMRRLMGQLADGDYQILKHGRTIRVGRLVETERELVGAVVSQLELNPKALVVGHNVNYDLNVLLGIAEREAAAGSPIGEAVAVLNAAAHRVADTMLGSQARFPRQGRLSLEVLGHDLLGETLPEAHAAHEDALLTARLVHRMRAESAEAVARLKSASRLSVKKNDVLWDRESRRAYRLEGVVDPAAAESHYQRLLPGSDGVDAHGFALREISHLDPKQTTGPQKLVADAVPHGLARRFDGQFEVMQEAQAVREMQASTEDYARKRIRRLWEGDRSFETVLKEEGRRAMAQAQAEGTLPALTTKLAEQEATHAAPFARRLARDLLHYQETLTDPRIAAQLNTVAPFLDREISGAHAPVVEWLKAHVMQAGPGQDRQAVKEASTVWNRYMRATEAASPFAESPGFEIPAAQRKLALVGLDEHLGLGALRVRVGSEELVRRDLARAQRRIIAKLHKDGDAGLDQLLQASEPGLRDEFLRRLKGERALGNTPVGRAAEDYVWSKYLRPAMADPGKNVFRMAGGETGSLALQAATLDDALGEIVAKGQAKAAQEVRSLQNPLVPRALAADRLQGLRQQFMGTPAQPRSVSSAYLESQGADGLVVGLRHGLPRSQVGKSYRALLKEAEAFSEEQFARFTGTLGRAKGRMTAQEQMSLKGLLSDQRPDLLRRLFPVEPQRAIHAPVARTFVPGRLNGLNQQLAAAAAGNGESLAGLGIIAAALLIGATTYSAVTRPKDPAPAPPKTPDEHVHQATASTDIFHQQAQTHRIRVSVEGTHPGGLDPHEIVQSMHAAIGSFMGQEVNHTPAVEDNRATVDKTFMDKLGERLLKR